MLRITKQADYGIVLLTIFARGTEGAVLAARDLALDANLPLPMVSKTLKRLSAADLLVSHRGVHGGYSLARTADRISVSEIIAALEGPIALTECSDGHQGDCDHAEHCPTQAHWQKISQVVHEALSRLSLADMTRPLSPAAARPGGAGDALDKLHSLPAAGSDAPVAR